MKQTLVLATTNQGKLAEMREMLGNFAVEIMSLADFGPIPEIVEDGKTFDENSYKKAHQTAKILGLPAIADDSGLVVAALDGRPGVHSSRYAGPEAGDADNIKKLLEEMKDIDDRRAAFACVISIAVPAGPALTYEGRCEGEIAREPDGNGGFGYDPVFFYPEYGRTFAQCSMEEKNRVSHRGRALAEMATEFGKILVWIRQRLAEVKPPKPDHRQFADNDWSS